MIKVDQPSKRCTMKTISSLALACLLLIGSFSYANFNGVKRNKHLLSPPPPIGTGGGLRGMYYNGSELAGSPLVTRIDSTINFELTYLSPIPGIVPQDKFSVRWVGQVQAQFSETYTFYTQSDDGIRLWVNGVKLIDNWETQGVTEKSGTIPMVAGQLYDVTIEYYENAGDATAKLLWSGTNTPKSVIPRSQLYPPPPAISSGIGLLGVYFNDVALAGAPLLKRIDSTINFSFPSASQPPVLSPAPVLVPEDNYSVRWSGQLEALYNETHTIYVQADDGVRLWVNGSLLIDNWQAQGFAEKSGTIQMEAGKKYDIVLEYVEKTGNNITKLYWSSPSMPKAIIPKQQLYPPATGMGLHAVYYSGVGLSGTPLLTRVDSVVDFELTYTKQPVVLSPAPGVVPDDNFSVRWTGQVLPKYAETYTFSTLTDDGVRLWVNGTLLVDSWGNQGATEKSGTITLAAGQLYDIVMEYFESAGEAVSKLYWSSASTPKQLIPTSQLFAPRVIANATAIAPLPPVDTTAPAPEAVEFRLTPNPLIAGRAMHLAIQSPDNMPAAVNVWGINGNKVQSLKLNLVKGNNNITLSTAGMTSGVYVIAVQFNGNTINRKLVLQ